MKLAVVGSGPLAILSAVHFKNLGAEVVVFQKNPLGGNARFLLKQFKELEFYYYNELTNIQKFWDEVLVPSIEFIENENITKAGNVLRIQKRFLDKNEAIENKSRLHDLFRIIYSINPKDSILKQAAENPEVFDKLGENVLASLHLPVESFEDFDLVIEATGRGNSASFMGAGCVPALNEINLKQNTNIFYEKEIFQNFNPENEKHIIIVGEGKSLVLILKKLEEWLNKNPENQISIITSKKMSEIVSEQDTWFYKELKKLLAAEEIQYDKNKIQFEKKLFEWRDLEDYVKAKIPCPVEPARKIKIYSGYDVTSIDRLLDREGLFVTIESPDFRAHSLNANDLLTIPSDAILVAKGHELRNGLTDGLKENEPGYFRITADDLETGLRNIMEIEKNILGFFSKVNS